MNRTGPGRFVLTKTIPSVHVTIVVVEVSRTERSHSLGVTHRATSSISMVLKVTLTVDVDRTGTRAEWSGTIHRFGGTISLMWMSMNEVPQDYGDLERHHDGNLACCDEIVYANVEYRDALDDEARRPPFATRIWRRSTLRTSLDQTIQFTTFSPHDVYPGADVDNGVRGYHFVALGINRDSGAINLLMDKHDVEDGAGLGN